MSDSSGRLVIAGTSSGVGKTSLSLGLARALGRRSLRVQPFKVGPDFLDPTYLTRATGRTCYNLDGWMTDRRYVEQLFHRVTADADVALVEGVMGMFDGADPASLTGSTAEIAAWIDAPVLLVVNAHGMARTLAAVVKGFVEFEPSVRIAGVVANLTGSERHRHWLSEDACKSLRAAQTRNDRRGIDNASRSATNGRRCCCGNSHCVTDADIHDTLIEFDSARRSAHDELVDGAHLVACR